MRFFVEVVVATPAESDRPSRESLDFDERAPSPAKAK